MKILLYLFLSAFPALRAALQAPHYKVYAIRFAALPDPVPVSFLVDMAPGKDSINMDFMVWLIKGENGKTILLDAGF